MSDWLLTLPVLWMTVVIVGSTYVFTIVLYVLVTALATGEMGNAVKAISPGMLPPLAVVFALLIGFLAAQVWNDADRANTAVNREASALRETVLLATAFPGATESAIRDVVRREIQDAVNHEWPAMARGQATLTIVPAHLSEALHMVIALKPENEGQAAAQRELIDSLKAAFDARRQRIILSRSSVNWVKWTALLVQAALTMVTIALVHSHNRIANRIILAIFATGIGVSFVLIASHSRPFTGEMSVSPSALLQVMPEAGAPH